VEYYKNSHKILLNIQYIINKINDDVKSVMKILDIFMNCCYNTRMKVIATNRRAMHDYHVIETYEAGLVLKGSEVKSLRQGTVSLSDAYGELSDGEVYLFNLHISPYKFSTVSSPHPKRKRKLLLNRSEIKRL